MGRRLYCDYCGMYLTHDSARSRKEHRHGWKHRENFRKYYMKIIQDRREEQQRKLFEEKGLPMPPMGMPPPNLPFPPPMLPGMGAPSLSVPPPALGEASKRVKTSSE